MTETNNSVKRKEELQCELEKLKNLKNDAVKQQRYDVAANLREKQSEVEIALKEIEDEEHKKTLMKLFTLNHTNSTIEYILKSKESYITIKSIHLQYKGNDTSQWMEDFSKMKLLVTHHYLVYANEPFVDERKLNNTILLFPEINQSQPIIHLNQTIKNDVLTIGMNPTEKFYTTLKLEIQHIKETFEVFIDIELFEVEEKC